MIVISKSIQPTHNKNKKMVQIYSKKKVYIYNKHEYITCNAIYILIVHNSAYFKKKTKEQKKKTT